MMANPQTLVLGFGNSTRGDDGIGCRAIVQLAAQAASRPWLRLLDGGTSVFDLLGHVEECVHLIVIDAAELGASPGTIRCFVDAEMDRRIGRSRRTVHEIALRDLFDMARLREALPRRRALIGVQPSAVGWAAAPCPELMAVLPAVCNRALELARAWAAST